MVTIFHNQEQLTQSIQSLKMPIDFGPQTLYRILVCPTWTFDKYMFCVCIHLYINICGFYPTSFSYLELLAQADMYDVIAYTLFIPFDRMRSWQPTFGKPFSIVYSSKIVLRQISPWPNRKQHSLSLFYSFSLLSLPFFSL